MDTSTIIAAAEPTISRLARQFFRNADDREDAEQSARLALIEALPQFDVTRGCLGAFTYRIIENCYIDISRASKAQHRQAEGLLTDPLGAGGANVDSFIRELMTRPDDILSKRDSRLFQLYILTSDRSELADILGVTNAVADQRVCRLRRTLTNLAAA